MDLPTVYKTVRRERRRSRPSGRWGAGDWGLLSEEEVWSLEFEGEEVGELEYVHIVVGFTAGGGWWFGDIDLEGGGDWNDGCVV